MKTGKILFKRENLSRKQKAIRWFARVSVFLFVGVILFFYLNQRSTRTIDGKVTQGVIRYDITYVKNNLTHFPAHLLPTLMIYKFNRNYSSMNIEGFLGFFEIINFLDHGEEVNTTLLKVMNNKLLYRGSANEFACCYDTFPNMKVVYTNETKVIAGYPCKKAVFELNDSAQRKFDVYYTDRIKTTNVSSQFKDIDGALMEFNLHLNAIEMRLSATKVEAVRVSDKEFDFPKGYKRVTRRSMQSVLTKLMK